MKARRTPWWHYALAMLLGLLGGAGLVKFTENSQISLIGAPWIVPIVLVLLAVVVLVLALQVHQYAKGERQQMDPERAVDTLILAKALGLAGAALAGWYGGQALMSLVHASAPFYSEALAQCAVSAAASLVDMIIGIISEWLCQLPPIEGPEHPKAKQAEAERVRRSTAAEDDIAAAPESRVTSTHS